MVSKLLARYRAAGLLQGDAVPRGTVAAWSFAALFLVGVSVAFLIWTLSWTRYGFDLSDESSYINAILNPFLYDASITQHGFFYHYLFHPYVDDVAMLRMLNIVVTLGLGALFGATLIGGTRAGHDRPNWPLTVAAALPFSFATLLFVGSWLSTPSYNTLNFQGLLIAATALALIASPSPRVGAAGCFFLVVGGWITFLAKPSSAALLAVVSLVYLAALRRLTLARLVSMGVGAALLLALTALIIDGSIPGFIDRIVRALPLPALLDPRYGADNLFRYGMPDLPDREWLLLVICAAILASAILLCGSSSPRLVLLGIVLTVGIASFPLLTLAGFGLHTPSRWVAHYPMHILAVPLGIGVALLARAVQKRLSPPAMEPVALAILLWTLPYIFVFGTNNDYWPLSAKTGIFWAASAIVLLRALQNPSSFQRAVLPVAAAAFAISISVLIIGLERPYRQTQPLRLNDKIVDMGETRAPLVLSDQAAAYFGKLADIAAQGGFRPGTPMVDLTGHHPGALFALGAEAVGLPWIVGGYVGSEAVAKIALARVPCATLARAWLLTQPEGPRAISQSVLGSLSPHFEVVGSLASPIGALRKRYPQHLLRPVFGHSDRVALCERDRQAER